MSTDPTVQVKRQILVNIFGAHGHTATAYDLRDRYTTNEVEDAWEVMRDINSEALAAAVRLYESQVQ